MVNQEVWTIDVDRSALRFSVRHKLLGEIAGQFHCWGGQLRTDSSGPRGADVRIWVELSSIDTGSPARNDEILRTELFDQREEPALEFDGARVEIDASDHLTVVGWLGLHAFRKEIAVTVEDCVFEFGTSVSPRFVCTAKASVERKALGLRRKRGIEHWLNDRLVANTIDIAAHIEATLQNPGSLSPRLMLGAAAASITPLRVAGLATPRSTDGAVTGAARPLLSVQA